MKDLIKRFKNKNLHKPVILYLNEAILRSGIGQTNIIVQSAIIHQGWKCVQ